MKKKTGGTKDIFITAVRARGMSANRVALVVIEPAEVNWRREIKAIVKEKLPLRRFTVVHSGEMDTCQQ